MKKLTKEIIQKIPNSPGVYYIKNIVNQKGYIGKSFKLRKRLLEHYKKRSDKHKVLYKAFDKHGLENFEFTILQYIEENTENLNTVLSELEIYYIKEFNTFKHGYNLTLGGDGVSGKVYSEEEREKMRQRYLNNSPLLNYSQECKRITYSYNLDTKEIKTFNSRKEAANYLISLGYKSSDTQIVKVINNKINKHHNHIFANSLEDLNIKVNMYNNKKSQKKYKIDYDYFYNQLLMYVDDFGVLPTMNELEVLLNMPKTNISRKILELQKLNKLIKISIMSRPRVALSTVDKNLFITKVKLINIETNEILILSDEKCAELLQYKPSTIKAARTKRSILKGFQLESCCIYNIIKTSGIDSITGIWKQFNNKQ